MNPLHIPATASSPEIEFRFDAHELSLRGESFPENAAAFFGPVIASLREFLALPDQDRTLTVDVALTYFNSSSTKMLFTLFDMLDKAAGTGRRVVLHWQHDVDDDTIREFGEELAVDFKNLEIRLRAVDA
ncbi:MAG: DUF1987 domain-containing protein [Proteobacteria bacterium]|jgi:SiaC family regulatory phosphoprotein|nr:Fe-S oxidoreductase [Methylibium sp.]MBY0368078.1 DUF1987 domain-containing protein [Burkholderiaceae bacterium]MCH8857719.1 DUF1987 domain-containing protein [Pseudomonadota bacterium]